MVRVDQEGNISETFLQSLKSESDEEITAFDTITIDNEEKIAYLFRLDLTHKDARSEVYLDLFDRLHKTSGNSATFTIQGSSKTQTSHQHPIGYLISSIDLSQPFLSFTQLKDVFHELGHLMHVGLSKTSFQMINGARVPLDFAEVPSHFTEQFVYDYEFVKQWATDHEDKPIDRELFHKIVVKERVVEMISLQELLYFSLLDLHFHKLKKEELSLPKLREINSRLVCLPCNYRCPKLLLQEL